MNLCVPVTEDLGIKSTVCGHFGSAPMFIVVDTESGGCRAIRNDNQHHGHGMCQPLESLRGERIDAIAVGGIGAGALGKLRASGMKVVLAEHATVEATLEAFRSGRLRGVEPGMACGGHGHPHGGQ